MKSAVYFPASDLASTVTVDGPPPTSTISSRDPVPSFFRIVLRSAYWAGRSFLSPGKTFGPCIRTTRERPAQPRSTIVCQGPTEDFSLPWAEARGRFSLFPGDLGPLSPRHLLSLFPDVAKLGKMRQELVCRPSWCPEARGRAPWK